MRLPTIPIIILLVSSLIVPSYASLAPNNIDPNPNPIVLFTHPTSAPNLIPRQGVAPAVNPAPVPPAIVQMSPITTYPIHGPDGNIMNIPYTQLFPATPDPWPAPTQGTIGLGTIVGNIGVVKSQSKRGLSLETGVVERIRVGIGSRAVVQGSEAGGIGMPSVLGIGAVVGFVLGVGAL